MRKLKKIFLRDRGCYRSRDSPFCMGNSGDQKERKEEVLELSSDVYRQNYGFAKKCYGRYFVKMNKTPRQKNSSYVNLDGICQCAERFDED